MVINRSLEEKILELMAGRAVHSPDTSSCHEVHVPTTDRSSIATHSPHASPLSASLASSEGSLAFTQNEPSDPRNLQASLVFHHNLLFMSDVFLLDSCRSKGYR